MASYMREEIIAIDCSILYICTGNNWTSIDNYNIDELCLLHNNQVQTNRYGYERLAHNIAEVETNDPETMSDHLE